MRIACISDLHGNLPNDVPDADLLLIGGDIVPYFPWEIGRNLIQAKWLEGTFNNWLEKLHIPVIAVAGNHDFVFAHAPHLVPKLPWTYLQDQETTFKGLKIYGSPWQFTHWAFGLDEPELEEKWKQIPDDTDILLLHSPPYGYGDSATRLLTDDNEEKWQEPKHIGSPSLFRKIIEIRPQLVVYGHVHPCYGVYKYENITLVNASLVNSARVPVNKVILIDL